MKSRRSRIVAFAVLAGVLLIAVAFWWAIGMPMPAFGPWTYLGSKYADNYHTHSCLWADQIRSENRVYFSSGEAAQAKGYKPCPVCIAP